MTAVGPHRISRRDFLRSLGAATGTLALSPFGPASPQAARRADPARRRVVVVGAGLAGLTAALDLVDAGWDVSVFEARDRVGGRVRTLYDPFSGRLHAESGGESIDDSHHAIRALIRRFGLHTEHRAVLKPYDSMVYYQGKREPLAAFLARRGGAVLRDVLRFYDAMAALGEGVDPQYPERAPGAEELDGRSLESFLDQQDLVPEAEFLMRLQNRAEYNAELIDLSLLFVAQQEAVAAGGVLSFLSSESRRIAGGNSRLPEAMAAALGGRIRLSAPVTAIEQHAGGVRVHAGGGATDAAWAVLATPMQPLRRVHFDPALPGSVRATVDGLDLGDAVKVIRQYRVPFWTAEGFSGFTLTDLPFAVAWAPTDSYPTPRGILTEFVTGDAARTASGMTAAEREQVFLAQLDEVYPEGEPLATSPVATVAWANERYTGGGYAVYRPGQLVPFFPVLREGTGRLRFAGEHASPLAGYMESAVRSGHGVAMAIGPPA